MSFSQKNIWEKIPDDAKHFYAGSCVTITTAETVNYLTDRPLLSTFVGIGTGILAGCLKEFVYDGYLKRGVKSMPDMGRTAQGSVEGGMAIGCVFHYRNTKNEIDTTYFQNLK